MNRVLVLAGVGLWLGLALILSELRWVSRRSLLDRLRPYAAQPVPSAGNGWLWSADSLTELVGPLCRDVGERAAAALGVSEDLSLRLTRLHSPMDATGFRVRQVGWSLAAFGAGTLAASGIRPPLPIAGLLVLGGPALAFTILEHQLSTASRRWQRRVFLELPVVGEQLAMLLSAGYSLTDALNRVAGRGRGACARDLARVCRRIRQGLSDAEALQEWAATAQVPAVDRLVAVLALNREASDLGRLLSEESRAIRRDVHRELIETVERRAQQVWVPVTVATLVPGVVFLAIPFIEALRLFAG